MARERYWDHDKTLPRGSAPGTRGGRSVRMSSRPASRDLGAELRGDSDPPPGALIVVRPSFSLFRPAQWIAVTAESFEVRQGRDITTVRRGSVEAIRYRGRRIEFAGAGGEALATAPTIYGARQIGLLADLLGVRVVRDR